NPPRSPARGSCSARTALTRRRWTSPMRRPLMRRPPSCWAPSPPLSNRSRMHREAGGLIHRGVGDAHVVAVGQPHTAAGRPADRHVVVAGVAPYGDHALGVPELEPVAVRAVRLAGSRLHVQ